MLEMLLPFIGFYLFGLVISIVISTVTGASENVEISREGARLFFLSFIWPLALLWFIPGFIRDMWIKTGWGSK